MDTSILIMCIYSFINNCENLLNFLAFMNVIKCGSEKMHITEPQTDQVSVMRAAPFTSNYI